MNLDDFIVNIFCQVDDFMKKHFQNRTLRKRGPLPQLADSEVVTMEIIGEYLGLQTDKKTFEFFKNCYHHFFPKLTNRVTFLRQAANLWAVKHKLFEYIANQFADTVAVLDSFPVAVCRFARAKYSKLFKGIATYGKEMGNQTFYGFRLHLKINSIGMIQTFQLAPANVHDIHILPELTYGDRGLVLGDKGYYSKPLRQELLERQGLELSVPTKYGEPTQLGDTQLRMRKRVRRLIETVGSQLSHYFSIKKIWARDLWHLTNRICRKILAHTFSILLCMKNGIKPLRFSKLLTC